MRSGFLGRGVLGAGSIAVLIAVACQGLGTQGPDPAAGSTRTVDESGGVVSLDLLTLTIPPGALDRPVRVTIERTAEAPPLEEEAYSPVYRFEPSGLVFKIPATLRVGHGPGIAAPALFWTLGEEDAFERKEGTDDGVALVAPVEHFCRGFLGACRFGSGGGSCHASPDAGGDGDSPDGKSAAGLDGGDVAPGAPTAVCTRRIHGAGRQLVHAVAVAKDGRIAVSGNVPYIAGATVDLGAGVVPLTTESSFVAVYGPSCNHLWSRVFEGQHGLNKLAFDDAGDLVVGGLNYTTIDFGGGPIKAGSGTGLDYDAIVAKYDPAYNLVFAKEFGDHGDGHAQVVDGLGVDPAGNVYVGGSFLGSLDFGGGALVAPTAPPPMTRKSVYLAKLSPLGAHVFSKMFPTSDGNFSMGDVSVGPGGEITLTGSCANGCVNGPTVSTIDFGGGPRANASSSYDWAARLTSTGSHIWSEAFPTRRTESTGARHVLMSNGDVVLIPSLVVPADFGFGPVSGKAAVVRVASGTGNALWSRSFPASNFVGGAGTASGGILLTGPFDGTIDPGCGPLASAGVTDLFLTRLASDGRCLYAVRMGDESYQNISLVAAAPSGATVLVGHYNGTISVGGVSLPNDEPTPVGLQGADDAFVAVLTK